jgi:hypothetical protein
MNMFVPIPDIANTPLPEGYEPEDLFLRRFILNAQQSVSANEVAKYRLLKDHLHAHVQEQFGAAIGSLIDMATDELYTRLCSVPDDEQECDSPDPYDLDLPPPATE